MGLLHCLPPLLLLLLLSASAAAGGENVSVLDYEAQFEAWCAEHGKAYATPGERAARLAAFAENADFVAAHNAGGPSYTLALNAFADLTHDEFRAAASGDSPLARARAPSGRPCRRTGASRAAWAPCPTRWTGGRAAPSPRSRTRAAAAQVHFHRRRRVPQPRAGRNLGWENIV